MSLYYEAANILESAQARRSSIKSIVFSNRTWKSDSKTLFALTTEAAKWSEILSEVFEKTAILRAEKTLSPALGLVLAHDLLLSKRGIALPAKHGLNTTISRHKARLSAELTKARLRRGFSTLEALRAHVNERTNWIPQEASSNSVHPRWIRINALKATLEGELGSTFSHLQKTTLCLKDFCTLPSTEANKYIYIDPHVPNLIAVHPTIGFSNNKAYKKGRLIFQDKASCFPATLLDPEQHEGDVIDACAAPGNKTTHLAAILNSHLAKSQRKRSKIFACEKDAVRSQTLENMVRLSGATDVKVQAKQDFSKLNPNARMFRRVTGLLLDPSCSGSGIVRRDEVGVAVHLPKTELGAAAETPGPRGTKRKRASKPQEQISPAPSVSNASAEETPNATAESSAQLKARLTALSSFQLRLLQHAMLFPAAKRIIYSTCSLYAEENEHVVIRALQSSVAHERGWRILRRDEQVKGLREWERRGDMEAVRAFSESESLDRDLMVTAEACIRCDKGSEEGTIGFFVAGFMREQSTGAGIGNPLPKAVIRDTLSTSDDPGPGERHNGEEDSDEEQDEGEWEGFNDES